MAALVQTLPQQSGSVTMLHSRPSASPGVLPPPSQSQSSQQYSSHRPRPSGPTGFRAAVGPIQPYAFTSTPALGTGSQWQQYPQHRSSSTPSTSTASSHDSSYTGHLGHFASVSMTNLGQTLPSLTQRAGTRDDSAIPTRARVSLPAPRPQSAYMPGASSQTSLIQAAPGKQAPDRYRRAGPRFSDGPVTAQGSAIPSGSGMAMVGHLYTAQPPVTVTRSKPAHSKTARPRSFYGTSPAAMDDIQLHKQRVDRETKRYRRRSIHTLDAAGDYPSLLTRQELMRAAEETSRLKVSVPQHRGAERVEAHMHPRMLGTASSNMHARNDSSDSVASNRSRASSNSRPSSRPSSSANRNNNAPPATGNPTSSASENTSKDDSARAFNVPPRSSSTDVPKRAHNPSPLSQPVTMESDSAQDGGRPDTGSSPAEPSSSQSHKSSLVGSPAAKQLAAINEKGKKSKTSRLRRAFSFGSAADLKKAAGDEDNTKESDKPNKEPSQEDSIGEEQARVAKKQEEGGIGNNIYGARLFSGSTDNISVSSTASSASIMIRKMGRGMKKRTRSLVGLFRPKSVIGVPAADANVPESTTAAVTMVTVEAERERVNVSPDLHTHNGGGTGFPRLERNSIDGINPPERLGSSGTDTSGRKSIVGGEKDRAEVLAAVRKGILKKGGSSSPSHRPQTGAELPDVPAISDSPYSTAPSTPNSEAQGYKRSESVAIGSEDYFVTALRLRQDTRSAPNTPQGTVRRSATFSPRIVFYDTWPSQEYDRRGDVATCNRLTPMLAQQIKEELNNFKMEMEVHENSKIYTHFF